MTYFAFPFQIDPSGRIAQVSREEYIQQLIEQVVFTMPGERVNHPEFGSAAQQFVFAPGGSAEEVTAQQVLQSNLQQFLGALIQIENVQVVSDDNFLNVTVNYIVLQTQERDSVRVTNELASWTL